MKLRTQYFRLLVAVCLGWCLSLFVALYTTRRVLVGLPLGETSCERSPSYSSKWDLDESPASGRRLASEVKGGAEKAEKDVLHFHQKSSVSDADVPESPKMFNKTGDLTEADESHKMFWPLKAKPEDHGYGGRGVEIDKDHLNQRERKIFDHGYEMYKVNQLASDVIPLRREINISMPECSHMRYDTSRLPRAGVVLIFYNELWSVLLRTVFSILDAGPYDLITEIVLVDDASDKEYLGKPLEDYLMIFNGKVKLVRLPERKGLIQARIVGFEHVTGDVAVFLDAHCEVNKGWLEPLLQRIQEDKSVLAVPATDRLNWDTFEFSFEGNVNRQRGGFDFDLTYSWIPPKVLDKGERRKLEEPVKSPTHLGCCFAVAKETFERLGRYDPQLQIWGCENLELSFKTWMCGGSIEIIPCSHIAHLYRPSFPYSWGENSQLTLVRNCIRVAEVWLDEYKEFFFDRIGHIQTEVDIGDITERQALRERLQCRSFHWYVKEVYPELYLPLKTLATGWISNVADGNICMSRNMARNDINIAPVPRKCDRSDVTQHFILTKEGQIRRDQNCLAFDRKQQQIISRVCDMDHSKWLYTKTLNIVSVKSQLCLTLSNNRSEIIMAPCDPNNPNQQWHWPRGSVVLS